MLIVEDDPETREMLRQLLSTAGFYTVAAAGRTRGAAPAADRAPSRAPRALPRAARSQDAAARRQRVRRAQLGDPTVANVPVAVMSGAADLEQRAAAMGAVATLPKPLDIDVLIEVVRRYCA